MCLVSDGEEVKFMGALSSDPRKQGQNPPQGQAAGDFEQSVIDGHYLGILESYRVSWDLQKAIRDTWQNFYDAENGVDSVDVNQLARTITISGTGEYDYRKLLHIGGTSKEGRDDTIGGFGEGAKILSLVLLRDFKFESLKFGSGDWEIEFYLDKAPEGSYDDPKAKGLYAKLRKKPYQKGNYIEFVAKSESQAKAFVEARNLFYHQDNPDCKDPDVLVKVEAPTRAQGHITYGFRYLGLDRKGGLVGGNFYDCGQRFAYNPSSAYGGPGWNKVEGLHIFVLGNKTSKSDRDRGAVTSLSVESEVIGPMVKAMSDKQLIDTLFILKDFWINYHLHTAAEALFVITVEEMAKRRIKVEFPDNLVAPERFISENIRSTLTNMGLTVCRSELATLGMNSAESAYLEEVQTTTIRPTTKQKRRMALLKQTAQMLNKLSAKYGKKMEVKDILLFDGSIKKVLHGKADNGEVFIWMSDRQIEGEFAMALSTYLHELDHIHGGDASAKFSEALTGTIGITIEAAIKSPKLLFRQAYKWKNAAGRLKRVKEWLKQYWEDVKP
ncbi:MAG: hypothetical protein R3A13_02510 [Bdellovibrionota bacterium]